MTINGWLITAIILKACFAWSAISKDQAIQTAETYIHSIDNGFFANHIQKQTPVRKIAIKLGLSSNPQIYGVYFELEDREQELLHEFAVFIWEDSGEVALPGQDSVYSGWCETNSQWLSKQAFCRFHPDDEQCDIDYGPPI